MLKFPSRGTEAIHYPILPDTVDPITAGRQYTTEEISTFTLTRAKAFYNLQIIEKYVNAGFVQIEFHKTYFNSEQIYYHSQLLNYHDCLYRYQGVYEYAVFLDVDDFFIPRVPGQTSLLHYLHKFLPNSSHAAVQFHWHLLFPDCGFTEPISSAVDGNVTQILRVKKQWVTGNSKFACRPSLTTHVEIHKALGYTLHAKSAPKADNNIACVGHFRLDMHTNTALSKNITCTSLTEESNLDVAGLVSMS